MCGCPHKLGIGANKKKKREIISKMGPGCPYWSWWWHPEDKLYDPEKNNKASSGCVFIVLWLCLDVLISWGLELIERKKHGRVSKMGPGGPYWSCSLVVSGCLGKLGIGANRKKNRGEFQRWAPVALTGADGDIQKTQMKLIQQVQVVFLLISGCTWMSC